MNRHLTALLSMLILIGQANADTPFNNSFYVGGLGGFGSTTWDGLVPSQNNQNIAMSMSTPIRTDEGGGVWGLLAGYEISPFFAIEADYIRYPGANILFSDESIFTYDHNGSSGFNSHTETVSLMGKVQLIIPNTRIRIYSSAGLADVHRLDIIVDAWRFGAAFGAGANYQVTQHVLAELGANYTSGYGESQLNPTDGYFPFLYSVSMRLAYCF